MSWRSGIGASDPGRWHAEGNPFFDYMIGFGMKYDVLKCMRDELQILHDSSR
jgi:hypothetical protein